MADIFIMTCAIPEGYDMETVLEAGYVSLTEEGAKAEAQRLENECWSEDEEGDPEPVLVWEKASWDERWFVSSAPHTGTTYLVRREALNP